MDQRIYATESWRQWIKELIRVRRGCMVERRYWESCRPRQKDLGGRRVYKHRECGWRVWVIWCQIDGFETFESVSEELAGESWIVIWGRQSRIHPKVNILNILKSCLICWPRPGRCRSQPVVSLAACNEAAPLMACNAIASLLACEAAVSFAACNMEVASLE